MEIGLDIAKISIISIMSLFYMGFGAARLLSFPKIESGAFLLTPVIGVCIIICTGYWCGWLGIPPNINMVAALTISTAINIYSLINREGVFSKNRDNLIILAVALVGFFLALAPMKGLTFLGPIGKNGDSILYSNITGFLEQNTPPAPPLSPFKPASVQLSFINWNLPLGFYYFHAFIDKIVNHESYKTFSILTSLLFSFAVLTGSFLGKYVFGLGRVGVILTALCISMGPSLLWLHYNDYGMHLLCIVFIPLTFGLLVIALREGSYKALFLAALFTSCSLATYPLGAVPFAIGPFLVFALFLLWGKVQDTRVTLWRFAALFAMIFLINPKGIIQCVKRVFLMSGFIGKKIFGDVDSFVQWDEVYGLSHHYLPFESTAYPHPAIPGLLGAAALIILIYGIWKSGREIRWAFLALVFVYIPFLIWIRFGHNYPYGYFKAMTFMVFPAVIGLAIGLEALMKAARNGFMRRITLKSAWLLTALILWMNLVNSIQLSKEVKILDLSPFIELKKQTSLFKDNSSISIVDEIGLPMLWLTYFLKDFNLTIPQHTPYYYKYDWPFYQTKIINPDFILVKKDSPLAKTWTQNIVFENSRYKLLKKDPGLPFYYDFWKETRILKQGEKFRIKLYPGEIIVDGKTFPLGFPLGEGTRALEIKAFIPEDGMAIFGVLGEEGLPLKDHSTILQRITSLPVEYTLKNNGKRIIIIQNFGIRDIKNGQKLKIGDESIFDYFVEELAPKSNLNAVSGWRPLEEWGRWSKVHAVSIFRNPLKPVLIKIGAHIREVPGMKAQLRLNGNLLSEFEGAGAYENSFVVEEDILGKSPWGELEVSVNHGFVPDEEKNLPVPGLIGLAIFQLSMEVLNLSRYFIDIGTKEGRVNLVKGWSIDEGNKDFNFVWADAKESQLMAYLPELHDLKVELRVNPLVFPSNPGQKIQVFVNNRFLREISLNNNRWETYSLDLPKEYQVKGVNRLRFVYDHVDSPSKVLEGNEDKRNLAVAFDFIRFRKK